MNNLKFDKNGNLFPYEIIETNLASFQKVFVEAFPDSLTRKKLFENYLRFTYRFQDEIFPFFEQWINGSFVTKKENPNDIDIVTFLDYSVYEKRGDHIIDKFWTFSLENEGIDSYIVKEYPQEHEKYVDFIELKKLWINTYSKTNPKKENKILSKGFLKINFEKWKR